MNEPWIDRHQRPADGPERIVAPRRTEALFGRTGSLAPSPDHGLARHRPWPGNRPRTGLAALTSLLITVSALAQDAGQSPNYLSPVAVAASPDGRSLYVACATANRIARVDPATRTVGAWLEVPGNPLGLAIAKDGRRLIVTCAGPTSTVAVIDTDPWRIAARISSGHTALAPVLSEDGRTLFVCSRFDGAIEVIDLAEGRVSRRIPVAREPIAAALTRDGRHLLVAHHLHDGAADAENVSSKVSVIDVAAGKVVRELPLPDGSTLLQDVRVSPDGRYAVVTHILARHHLPTTQVDRGWIASNALTLIDLEGMKILNTLLLDSIDAGAANPWAADWTADGRRLAISHAGTHEISVIDFPKLLERLSRLESGIVTGPSKDYPAVSRTPADVPNDLAFLVGIRERVPLPPGARGPRGFAWIGQSLWIANYFSESIALVDLAADRPRTHVLPLGSASDLTPERRGEALFNDATLCLQGWLSCATCHSSDARIDGMNWDLLNDGIGNPKNSKSLLQGHLTPPSMWRGVRQDSPTAVRAGIRNTFFTVQPPDVAAAMDAYLESLLPVPSPHLVDGGLSDAARRGKAIFEQTRTGCATCHGGELSTDLKAHDVGTAGRWDDPSHVFDTPSLVEVWRTGPYLHDGRAKTLREVLTDFNREDRHGVTSHLTPREIDDLTAYLLSL